MDTASHRTQYQGKRLLLVMLATCAPAAILYLRLVLGLAATQASTPPSEAASLNRWSMVALVVFFLAQLLAARYLQTMFPDRPQTPVRGAFQYLAALLMGFLFSLTGAIVLEAFGWNLFLRIPH